jgi:hypothetical protein
MSVLGDGEKADVHPAFVRVVPLGLNIIEVETNRSRAGTALHRKCAAVCHFASILGHQNKAKDRKQAGWTRSHFRCAVDLATRQVLKTAHEVTGVHVECCRQSAYVAKAHVSKTALKRPDIGAINPRPECKSLLAQADSHPSRLDPVA